jgi:hypothetical protein
MNELDATFQEMVMDRFTRLNEIREMDRVLESGKTDILVDLLRRVTDILVDLLRRVKVLEDKKGDPSL